MTAVAAAIVDSRNMFHQAGEATGTRACPSVPGVRQALSRFGYSVAEVHVGLALARQSDQQVLARQHTQNAAYMQQVLADGGQVLQGELHKKPSGSVEEKMVDSACCVRIARYVDEIAYGRTPIEAIVVLSKDIDLQPAVDYAVNMNVPIVVAAFDVVQHRQHPYLLLGPKSFSEITNAGTPATGHEMRESAAEALFAGQAMTWTVKGTGSDAVLIHSSGLRGRPAPGVQVGVHNSRISLQPVDVSWKPGQLPELLCGPPPSQPAWMTATVRRRTAPLHLEVLRSDGVIERAGFPLGGAVPGDQVIMHLKTGRIVGRLASASPARRFDPDVPEIVRVISSLPKGGALAMSSGGQRGLLNTRQTLKPGQEVPAIQADLQPRGPVWLAIGTPVS